VAQKTKKLEKVLYPLVERWLRRHFGCFATAINRGLRYGRIDVIGVRDIGGDLSGEVETIAVEVKRGSSPFANACGQTLGYSVYANRVYLADVCESSFSRDEVHIASHLGIGLIQIKGRSCRESLSSPYYRPQTKMNLLLLEALRLGQCQLCGSCFAIGTKDPVQNRFSRVCREDFAKAFDSDKGLIFWNREVAARKHKLKLRVSKNGSTFERRYLCPDCVEHVFASFALHSELEDGEHN